MSLFGRRSAARHRAGGEEPVGPDTSADQIFEAAERVYLTIGGPSLLGCAIVETTISERGVREGSDAFAAGAQAALMGYACRMPRVGGLDASLARSLNASFSLAGGGVSSERLLGAPREVHRLLEAVRALSADTRWVCALAGCTLQVWGEFCKRVGDTYAAAIEDPVSVGELVRLGYAVRVADEVNSLDPLGRAP